MTDTKSERDPSLYDLCQYFDDYVGEVGHNLQMDAEAWEKYQANPVPVYIDIVNDFGTKPDDMSGEEWDRVVLAAAKRHAGQ